MDRQPFHVLQDIERVTKELEQAGDKFAEVRIELAGAEQLYEQEFAKQLLIVYNRGKEEGKVPAEDLRKAMAHAALDQRTWAKYLTKKAEVEAMKVGIGVRQSILSALQSELQQMRVEMTHA